MEELKEEHNSTKKVVKYIHNHKTSEELEKAKYFPISIKNVHIKGMDVVKDKAKNILKQLNASSLI